MIKGGRECSAGNLMQSDAAHALGFQQIQLFLDRRIFVLLCIRETAAEQQMIPFEARCGPIMFSWGDIWYFTTTQLFAIKLLNKDDTDNLNRLWRILTYVNDLWKYDIDISWELRNACPQRWWRVEQHTTTVASVLEIAWWPSRTFPLETSIWITAPMRRAFRCVLSNFLCDKTFAFWILSSLLKFHLRPWKRARKKFTSSSQR